MEVFKDLFQEIKDRIRNPLFSSFAIAWIFFNWRITVAILFYDNEALKRAGYNTLNNLINAKQDNLKMIFYPLLSALFYVFVFPFIRNGITEFLFARKIENENKILEKNKKASVKLERYVDLLKELEDQQKLVGDIYSEQKKELERSSKLQNELNNEKSTNSDLTTSLTKLRKDLGNISAIASTPLVLSGIWICKRLVNGEFSEKQWAITGSDIYEGDERYRIIDFLYNPSTRQIHITLQFEIRSSMNSPHAYLIDYMTLGSYLLDYNENDKSYSNKDDTFTLTKKD
ncbi:hypothetical protein [Pedobacter rhizosphaerae]|uniref:Uncharacterized protein n=1 Tax=Pedobacter rhizosphaerae TaxID=390241 RepID=A0A1H9TSZ6_9SPHI|nr:hypothetical protein [Pedobacter rhizosphaerae]SES00209.1 hypothetical protein SAMN04488023_12470 [Pedobacter rhizosphaerae]